MSHHTSDDPNVFLLPDLGEGVHEAELIAWKIAAGDTVEELQAIAEMETDKALVEVPSPRAGVIESLHGEPGETLIVGNPLVRYKGDGTAPAAAPTAAAAGGQPAVATPENPPQEEDVRTIVGSVSTEPLFASKDGKAIAAPAVRRLARDLGVDLAAVRATGIAGRITAKDVRAAASGATTAALPKPAAPAPASPKAAPPQMTLPPPKPGETQEIPVRGTRKTIAARLRQSVDTAVHFYVMDEADVSTLDGVRKRTAAASGEKLSYLPFIASAVCKALGGFPALNAHFDDANSRILRHSSVHMGIATDTPQGLSVPVLADSDTLGVLQIGRGITALANAVRDRSIQRDKLMGSTFTISNVGSYAGRFATPILNYPEVSILGVGRARQGVVVRDGGIHIGRILPLSLGCDHRAVDGAEMAQFLAVVIDLLQNRPEELLAPTRNA